MQRAWPWVFATWAAALGACGGPDAVPSPDPRAAASPAPAPTPPPLTAELTAVVDAHRKLVVLLEGEAGLPPDTRTRANLVGRILFQENHQRLTDLAARLEADLDAGAQLLPAFLDTLEAGPELRDADKLAFRELVSELLARLRGGPGADAALLARLEADDQALAEIQALYEKELDRIFGRFETRGMTVRREAWESYVAFLRTRHSVEAILAEYAAAAGQVAAPPAGRRDLELTGARLPAKSLVLTFDDGPHARHTDKILAVLQRFRVKAVFFHVGRNLGRLGADGRTQATGPAAASRRLLQAGLPLANHSYSHSLLPRLSDAEIAREIELTNRMLREVSRTGTVLFRAPYGARDERVLAAVAARGMKSVMWNVDSKDWADPVPRSIANRAIRVVEGEGRGILLFHDIQARTVEALPLVLETLLARGYRFLTWNGSAFVDESPPPPPAPAAERRPLYRESWAVVIGIDEYRAWPRLQYAANDARAVRDLLIQRFRFRPERVTTLLDAEATRERILAALGDRLTDPAQVQREDRVFVFFAGHGVTRKLPSGRSLGYIVPVDADLTNFQSQAISMTQFQDVSEAIPAKHVFFVMDACYSGIALTRGGGASSHNYLAEVTRRAVRQMLTAGGADEQVADNGPGGHSIFTWTLLQGLGGRADLNADGHVTASELAAYVGPTVSALSKQTPAFGALAGSEGGEFVFELGHETEFLSDESGQLDEEALRLNAELDRLKAEVAAKRERNQRLKRELDRARAELADVPAPAPARSWAEHNDRGTALFRERKYAEAAAAFEAAARLAPDSALAANNLGFAQFKLDRPEQAVRWFERALQIDPERTIAYSNLGDALARLGRRDEARAAYGKYLERQPGSPHAEQVRLKLAALK